MIAYDVGGDGGLDLRPVAAFAGATLGVGIAYLLGRSVGGRGTTTLILAGVTVAAFLTAVQTYVQQRSAETVQEVYSWILGQLETSGWTDVLILLPYVAVSSAVLLWHRRLLDVLAVGDDEAASLGVPVARVRLLVVAAATLGTAAAVAFSGLIAFVGIIVPHAVRLMAGHELPRRPAALARVRRRLPRPHGPRRADGHRAGAAADRRRHRLPRRALLRRRPADDEDGGAVMLARGARSGRPRRRAGRRRTSASRSRRGTGSA